MDQSRPLCHTGRNKIGVRESLWSHRQSTRASSEGRRHMQWVSDVLAFKAETYCFVPAGKVSMSVLTKGLAMDFVREGKKQMAITSIWPAAVSDWNRVECHAKGLLTPRQSIESAATERGVIDASSKIDLRKPVSSLR